MSGSDDFDAIDWVSLDRYLAGEGSLEERAAVERRLAADPEFRVLIDRLRAGLDPSRDLADLPDPRSALARARARIARPETAGSDRLRLPTDRRFARWPQVVTLAVAAGIAILAVSVVRTHQVRGFFAATSYVTRSGQRLTVSLSDGTRLSLAPASRLEIPIDYASGNRSVRLEGEAFFDVVHDPAHPFSVRAGTLTATDVGTAFDVRAYRDDRAVRVAVRDGRVDLLAGTGTPSRRGTLSAGDVAVARDNALLLTHAVDIDQYTAWTRGELTFREIRAADAFREIARWHDIDVQITDPRARDVALTATFTVADPLDGVLDAIGRSLGERVERRGNRVVVSAPDRAGPAGLSTAPGSRR